MKCVISAVAGVVMAMVLCTSVHAVPAMPELLDVTQPDGTTIQVRQRGDEFQHWTETQDGYSVLRNPQTTHWEYAEKGNDGNLKPSGYRVLPQGTAPGHLSPHLKPVRNDKMALQQQELLDSVYQQRLQESGAQAGVLQAPGDWVPLPVQGSKNVLLVLVNFSNRTLVTTAADWNSTVFSLQGKSVARYFADNSFGALTVSPAAHSQVGSPAGVVKVTIGQTHPNSANNYNYTSESTILNLALAQAATVVNFSSFDANANGTLEQGELSIYFIYAGYEASGSAKTPSIWAHAWGGSGVTAGGLNVKRWAMNGELNNSDRQHPMGVIAHELGHALCGLPDLYDTSGTNAGMGIFSLMAGGSWGKDYTVDVDQGQTPTALDLWSREYLGWSTPVSPDGDQPLFFLPSLSEVCSGYRFSESAGATEYFLAENRYPVGWDAGANYRLGGSWQGGVLITHVDITAGTVGSNDINSFTATGGRQGVVPVQANITSCDMLTSDCRGHVSTLFYMGNNSEWSALSSPNSNYYSGLPSDFHLGAISAPGELMVANWSTTSLSLAAVVEDFETQDLSALPWQIGGNAAWTVTASGYGGGYAAVAPASMGDGGSAALQTWVNSESGVLSFRYKVSSEYGWDFLIFYVDDVPMGSWSGEVGWSVATFYLTAGEHLLKWEYVKDPRCCIGGADKAWIDDVAFPQVRYELSVNKTGTGAGHVTADPDALIWAANLASGNYVAGTVVTLTASPDPGSTFTGWSGACSGTGACIVTMDVAKSVTATFALTLGAPTGLTVPAIDYDGLYRISWGASPTTGVSYIVEESTSSDFSANLQTVYNGVAKRVDLSGRDLATRYYYRVKATNPGFNDSAWIVAANPVAVAAGAPGAVTAPGFDVDGSYTVSWVASATPWVTYLVHEATDITFSSGLKVVYSGSGTSVNLSGRSTGKTYYYRVRASIADDLRSNWAIRQNGCAIPGSSVTAAPGAPQMPTGDADGSYTVSWNPSATADVNYVLYEATNDTFSKNLKIVHFGPAASFDAIGRVAGTPYYYRVRATKAGLRDSAQVVGANGCLVGP